MVVDEDINIFDDAEVLWAVATRSRWDRDLIVIPNMICTTRDPTAYAGSPGDLSYHAYTVAKGGIDATMPAPPEPFEIRIKVPDEVMRKVQVADFVAKDLLSKIPPDAEEEKFMASSMKVECPGCDEVFLVSPQFERMKIPAKCPFCDKEFPIEQAKKVVRPSPMLLVK